MCLHAEMGDPQGQRQWFPCTGVPGPTAEYSAHIRHTICICWINLYLFTSVILLSKQTPWTIIVFSYCMLLFYTHKGITIGNSMNGVQRTMRSLNAWTKCRVYVRRQNILFGNATLWAEYWLSLVALLEGALHMSLDGFDKVKVQLHTEKNKRW